MAVSSVHIALAVSGHLGVNMVDRGRVVQRPLCKGQIDSKNARVSQTIVVDTWLWDQGVQGSSPGCARSTLSPWERLFTCISSPHSCVKKVPGYRQYSRVKRHL